MAEIRLTEGTICFQDEWLSADDIKARIKQKMDAGDMKFAEEAAALEKLNQAMENAHPLEVRLVLPAADYEKLCKRGGDDDNESVRKAIVAFIESADKKGPVMEKPKPKAAEAPAAAAIRTVACSKCNREVEIPAGEGPEELECDFCGTSILLEEEGKETPPSHEPENKTQEKTDEADEKNVRHKDHFIG
jgi:DNA-directed RNA polymerase subunit RPC12/RpoP